DLQALSLAACYFHPQLPIAIAEYNLKKTLEQTASRRINPRINIPLEHHSDTSGGKSPWLIGVLFDLVMEREGKRQARLDQAIAETRVARINVQAMAWRIYSQLRQQYIDYYAAFKQKELMQAKATIMENILRLLERRQELGQASEFEVSSTRLELQRIRLDITNAQVAMVDAFNVLAGTIGVPVEAMTGIEFTFSEIEKLSSPLALMTDDMQVHTLHKRLDIQQALQEYAVLEAGLRLEIEKQFPDLVLSPGFLFDQEDMIWALGVSWVLPVFQPQNEGPIRAALGRRDIKQKEFLALQATILNELSQAMARIESLQTALQEAETLVSESHEREKQIAMQYQRGYVDHLQLIRNQLETTEAEQALTSIRLAVIKSAGRLEDAIQYPLTDQPACQYILNEDEQYQLKIE
ncbi:MAG: hypothetical protein A2W28_05800, partial [Gammaproteobacteria bacterium RBG_16_51_14]